MKGKLEKECDYNKTNLEALAFHLLLLQSRKAWALYSKEIPQILKLSHLDLHLV
jgi:hypothetical protein